MLLYEKTGDKEFSMKEYSTSVESYEKAMIFFRPPIRLYYKLAYAYQMINNYEEAEKYYKKVIDDNDTINLYETFPLLHLNYANIAIENGNIFIGERVLKNLLKNTKDKLTIQRAKHILENIDWINENNKLIFGIRVKNLGDNVNNEYSQALNFALNDSILFLTHTSYNKTQEQGKTIYTDALQQIYTTIFSQNEYSPIKLYDEKILLREKQDVENICFDSSNCDLYFTLCNENKSVCYIYKSERKDGKYGKKKKLNSSINKKNCHNTHPNMGYYNGEKALYFSSNREGGYGGYDIYVYPLENNKDDIVINLGKEINTLGDEITPFYSIGDTGIYFSSNYHFGFGGFDIFRSSIRGTEFLEVENLMQPINSTANDIFPVIVDSQKKGYFSSNRESPYSNKNKTCCNDIYSFEVDNSLPNIPTIQVVKTKNRFSPIFSLPLNIYFDNDEPQPQSLSKETKANYLDLYNEYIDKENDYKSSALSFYDNDTNNLGYTFLNTFFNKILTNSFETLNSMCEYILLHLEKGERITLSVIGHSSALYNDIYNYILSERRVSCLINYLNIWKNGALSYYIKNNAEDNLPLLYIKTLALGKINSKSDNPQSVSEKRKTIFQKNSILERRVEIKLLEKRK
ncbi:MAG: hypothetical protein LBM25_02840 [Bacteroidales bacterium]|jgi:hypothetical protein|nr:hypothetical protein [Bacteroidales bacterium]